MNDDDDVRTQAQDDHERLREALGAYLLGHLDAQSADGVTEDAVRVHLAGCARCRTELAELQPVASALAGLRRRALPGGPLPAELGAWLDAAVSVEAGHRRRSRLTHAVTSLVAAAALLFVAVVGVRWSTPRS
ncbi:MAG: zf-HC2 domain-containing protein [Geodermatophilaceae bacterium]|nr:zf-HC2 domain-containing protein [Geodermatophilaceae bacterium]